MEFFLVVDTSADNQETYLPFDRELVEECKQQELEASGQLEIFQAIQAFWKMFPILHAEYLSMELLFNAYKMEDQSPSEEDYERLEGLDKMGQELDEKVRSALSRYLERRISLSMPVTDGFVWESWQSRGWAHPFPVVFDGQVARHPFGI